MSAFAFAGTCVCGKQSLGLLFCRSLQLQMCILHQLEPPFSRSYGCNLPSSLTRVFPRTLGYSPRLPVSVSVRAGNVLLEAFLGSVVHADSGPPKLSLSVSPEPYAGGICLPGSLQPSTRYSSSAPALPPASLHRSNNIPGCRNIRLLSIAYAFCLGLGPDLP